MNEKIRVGVIGVGYLGAIHTRIYNEIPEAELVAVVDVDEVKLKEISEKYKIAAYADYTEIFSKVDAVSIATPTKTHCKIAKDFLNKGIPVLLEKPISATIPEAEELVKISKERNITLQIGHVERFNPAIIALKDKLSDAKFIEAHRLAPIKMRSLDIGVVLDLMIHDLDIILSVVNSPPKTVQAVGINLLTPEYEDMVNARIIFENNAVANVTASRISMKSMRKIRFFTPSGYATTDFQAKEAFIYLKSKEFEHFDIRKANPEILENPMLFVFNKLIESKKLPIEEAEPLKLEILSFLNVIKEGKKPVVPGEDGLRAIKLAYQILDDIHLNLKKI